jgi:hypothetical protein
MTARTTLSDGWSYLSCHEGLCERVCGMRESTDTRQRTKHGMKLDKNAAAAAAPVGADMCINLF